MDITLTQQATQPNLSVTTENKIYTGTAARILKLLGAGCTAVEAARACGVGEAYVSQLQKEPSFQKQVNDLVTKAMADQSKIDENYNEIERQASQRLRDQIQYQFDPDKLMRLAKFANEAKRRISPIGKSESDNNGSGGVHIDTVNLILPPQVIHEFLINPQGEVVGLNGKELTTLPSKNITSLVEKHKQETKEKKQGFKLLNDATNPNVSNRETDPYSDL